MSDKHPTIYFEKEVDSIVLRPSQTLTVWFETGPIIWRQVELRVLPDGTPQIFVVPEVTVRGFDDYKSIETEVAEKEKADVNPLA